MSLVESIRDCDPALASEDVHREALIAEAVQPVAAELRLCELSSFARHILCHESANLLDLLESSSELYFEPEALLYAGSSFIDLNWNGKVTVCLHMKFSYAGVDVLFHLYLLELNSAVDVKFISFENPHIDPKVNTQKLAEALQKAKKSKICIQ